MSENNIRILLPVTEIGRLDLSASFDAAEIEDLLSQVPDLIWRALIGGKPGYLSSLRRKLTLKDKLELNSNAIYLRRKLFNEDVFSPIDIFALINDLQDFTLIFYPMSDRISGMCVKKKQSNIIGINSTLSYGRQRFTAAHELYHLSGADSGTTAVATVVVS